MLRAWAATTAAMLAHSDRSRPAWAALARHTPVFQRRRAAAHHGTGRHLVRVDSPTGGLADGARGLSAVRRPVDDRRFDTAIVGRERRSCAVAGRRPADASSGRPIPATVPSSSTTAPEPPRPICGGPAP